MASDDTDFTRAIAVALAATRRAHEFAKGDMLASEEMKDLGEARAAACNAAEAYCKRTGFSRDYFERMLLDGDLPTEGLLSAALDIAVGLGATMQPEPESLRVQAAGILRATIRLGVHWARLRGLAPLDVDPRLISDSRTIDFDG